MKRERLMLVSEFLWYRAHVDAEDEGLSFEQQSRGRKANTAAASRYDHNFVLET